MNAMVKFSTAWVRNIYAKYKVAENSKLSQFNKSIT